MVETINPDPRYQFNPRLKPWAMDQIHFNLKIIFRLNINKVENRPLNKLPVLH